MLCARGGGGGYVSGLVHTTCDDYDDGYKMMSANKILNRIECCYVHRG